MALNSKLVLPIYRGREEGCSKKFLGSIYQYANIYEAKSLNYGRLLYIGTSYWYLLAVQYQYVAQHAVSFNFYF